MHEEHIDYEHHPLTEDSPEVLEAIANGTLYDAGEPITDPGKEIARRTRAYIQARRLPDTPQVYSTVLRHTLSADPKLAREYLSTGAQAVTDRVKAHPPLASSDGHLIVDFANLLVKTEGGSMPERLHQILKYWPGLNKTYKAGTL
jgi:hypothetical protein